MLATGCISLAVLLLWVPDPFLTPPTALSAYYLKFIAPPDVQVVQVFKGVMPFLFMLILCRVLMYQFPQLVFHLPNTLYG